MIEVEDTATTNDATATTLVRYPLNNPEVFMAEARIIGRVAGTGQLIAFNLRHFGRATGEVGNQVLETRAEVNGASARIRVVAQGVIVEVLGIAGTAIRWWGWLNLWVVGPPPAP